MYGLLLHGVNMSSAGLLADRFALGSFFAISGWHKAFHPVRRASLKATFQADGCTWPGFMYLIPGGELLGGLGVLMGLFAVPAALGLILICCGACALDGVKRIPGFQPLTRADAIGDFLYLPEVLYVVMLAFIVAVGPGQFSLDWAVWGSHV